MNIRKHMALMGKKVKDRVSGFTGVVCSINFDLYGCIQATINPGVDKDGKPRDCHWFDVNRLDVLSDKQVMTPPDFDFGPVAEGRKGAGEKPPMFKP